MSLKTRWGNKRKDILEQCKGGWSEQPSGIQAASPMVQRTKGDWPILVLLPSTALDLSGAGGVHSRSHKINFLDEVREGHFRSCPEHLHQHTEAT